MALDLSRSTSDWWVCSCGNDARDSGFAPCDAYGAPVEPTPEDWDGGRWVCLGCLTILTPHDLPRL